MSVRLALGADRLRIVRQLLTESLVLVALGAAGGLALAWFGSRILLARALGDAAPNSVDIGMDLPVLAFTMGIATLAVALFGLAPALRASRVDVTTTMRAQGRGVSGALGSGRGGRIPIGKMLIAAQVALSLVLLVGSALLVRSLRNVETADTGMDRDHLLMVDVDALGRGYHEERNANLARTVRDRLARIPGVVAVSYSSNGIFNGSESQEIIVVPGFTAGANDSTSFFDDVGPHYATAIGGRVLQGRDIDERDVVGASPVIVVNRAFAEHYFPHQNPIGRSIRVIGSPLTIEPQIVGVITDARTRDLHAPVEPRVYLSYLQRPLYDETSLRFIVRTAGDPGAVAPAVRRELASVDPNLPIADMRPLATLMYQSIREDRLLTQLATAFGTLALLLAAIGLYGVMAYAVARRTGEIGLRMALGATARDVVRLVVSDALRVVAIGLLVGAPLAIAGARLLRSQLHGVSAADPIAVGAALAVLVVTSTVAALLPARRASRVTPVVALAQE